MYLSKRFYIFCVAAVVLFLAGFVFPVLFMAGKMLLVAQALLSAADIALLWRQKDGVYAERSCAASFSSVKLSLNTDLPCFSSSSVSASIAFITDSLSPSKIIISAQGA